ncbi:hypothetical protein TanjilG_19612 [Lupinus angustifolius]|uniref:Protein BIC1 n=2 Tax=Lupinus angustifolius TaxID=3871 RepID=L0P173_LUPAN|nr:hypothetical protein TanjilG_19612 [Lupinus angustifolius]CCH47172.1 hypothetical protein [Lupinus angustifolius]
MAHQSLVESNDKFPLQPLEFNSNNMGQQHKDVEQNTSASITNLNNNKEEIALQVLVEEESEVIAEDSERERLKKHRVEVAGRVWIPEIWGQENFLMDWIDCTTAFHVHLVPSKITTAQEALVEEGKKVNASGLSIENRC